MDERRRGPEGYPHGPAAALVAHTALDQLGDPRAVVLVEGVSDQIAVETLARRHGVDLEAARVAVVPVGGAQGLRRMLHAVVTRHPAVSITGLYDEPEEPVVRRALEALGHLTAEDSLEHAGFFACSLDLEEELIRACGVALVEQCLAEQGDLLAFRKLQAQSAWRDRPVPAQLRRWIASGARRKLRYARALVEAVPDERMPRPLAAALAGAVQA